MKAAWKAARWITPACAGKRLLEIADVIACQDHPRVCGEKFYGTTGRGRRRGSPPRVRGKVDRILSKGTWKRITPACAGKSL